MVDVMLDLEQNSWDCTYVNHFTPTIQASVVRVEEQFVDYLLEFMANLKSTSEETGH